MDLVALEEIRALKYRYLRSLDLKRWDEFADTLTEDTTPDYGSPSGGKPLTFSGRDEVVGYMRDSLTNAITTVHVASHPDITVDGDVATGSWCLEDTVLVPEHKVMIRGAAYYADRYRRDNGVWRIAHTGYTRIYEATVTLGDEFTLTKNLWS
jgi:hypothetical protein